ncbi:dirigent protein 10-like [Rhinolophus ferrumequinum]|uniref:dirigent protein 10-like n=1 Tax=Rhinolophus ferrumequinum TaxID=59479 RepID=UPI00140F7265|nr:dirigent protein 10-like [Rhinolophus ferrumequinum]
MQAGPSSSHRLAGGWAAGSGAGQGAGDAAAAGLPDDGAGEPEPGPGPAPAPPSEGEERTGGGAASSVPSSPPRGRGSGPADIMGGGGGHGAGARSALGRGRAAPGRQHSHAWIRAGSSSEGTPRHPAATVVCTWLWSLEGQEDRSQTRAENIYTHVYTRPVFVGRREIQKHFIGPHVPLRKDSFIDAWETSCKQMALLTLLGTV